MNHYCTYFDHRYLARGLALHASMERHCRPFRLWVLCLTDECHRALSAMDLPDIVLLRLEELEKHDPEFLATKTSRSTMEYYMTCTSALMTWLIDTRPEIDALTYIDSDIFFFRAPDALLEQFKDCSTLITPHQPKLPLEPGPQFKHGIYNIGCLAFRRDADGLACLRWWRARCIEWCFDRLEPERWLDQKYLDRFPEKFARVGIVRDVGVNVAPWNLGRYRLGASADGTPAVDGRPLVFFHFSGLRYVTSFLWRTTHRESRAPLNRDVRRLIYAPYLRELDAADRAVQRWLPGRPAVLQSWTQRIVPDSLRLRLREILRLAVRGGGIWVVGNRVL